MKGLIKDFERLQKKFLGYVMYSVRGSKEGWFIDAYTKNGLLIKTKMAYATEQQTRGFIEEQTKYLNHISNEDEV